MADAPYMSPELARLYNATEAVPGRPGWRRDALGKEWYSAAWINEESGMHLIDMGKGEKNG